MTVRRSFPPGGGARAAQTGARAAGGHRQAQGGLRPRAAGGQGRPRRRRGVESGARGLRHECVACRVCIAEGRSGSGSSQQLSSRKKVTAATRPRSTPGPCGGPQGTEPIRADFVVYWTQPVQPAMPRHIILESLNPVSLIVRLDVRLRRPHMAAMSSRIRNNRALSLSTAVAVIPSDLFALSCLPDHSDTGTKEYYAILFFSCS